MVFKKRGTETVEPDLTVAAMSGRRNKKGEVGIEIEVEGRNLPRNLPDLPWEYVPDGSLRGHENGEYILSKPIPFDKVADAIDQLWALFKERETQLDVADRTSVHVHLNVLPFYQNRLCSLMALWYVFEDVLAHWCGDHRVGNLFCLRAKDGPATITRLKTYIERKGETALAEGLHYAAMNAHAIQQHGSLEFRTLRGETEPERIKLWVEILRKLYSASERFPDPRTICESFSMAGPLGFFDEIFQEHSSTILKGVDFSEEQIRNSLYEGVRYAQDLCYARDWSSFNPVKAVPDPFGRVPNPPNTRGVGRRTALDEAIEELEARANIEIPRLRTGTWIHNAGQRVRILDEGGPDED